MAVEVLDRQEETQNSYWFDEEIQQTPQGSKFKESKNKKKQHTYYKL